MENDERVLQLQERLEEMQIALARFKTKDNSEVKRYRQARAQHLLIEDKMDDYYADHENECIEILKQGLSKYNVSFDLSDQMQIRVYFDFLVYPHFKENLCDLFLRKRKVRSEKNISMIKAMKESKVGLFRIKQIDPANYQVQLEDMLTGETTTIHDERMSILHANTPNTSLIMLRIITWDTISFQTGMGLLFDADDKDIRRWIKRNKNHYQMTEQMVELYRIYMQKVEKGTAGRIVSKYKK